MKQQLLPSAGAPPQFFVGRNRDGQWVVQDQSGRSGGIFVDRAEALRFAMAETGHRADAIVMVPGIFDLDLAAK